MPSGDSFERITEKIRAASSPSVNLRPVMDPAEHTESGLDERELIRRCCAGEPDAWDRLFDLHYAAAGRFVFQLMPGFSREDVEEVCQETFLAVVRRLASFDGRSRLQTWIFRVAANKARDYLALRLAAKRGGGHEPASLDAMDSQTGLAIDLPSTAPGPDATLLAREQRGLLRKALDDLGDPCREIIELRYFAELSYEAIGQALRLNLKTVSSRLSKCLDKLEVCFRNRLARESSAPTPV
jgi:RNA polymerase sigma-70 factor, ECF subfamily